MASSMGNRMSREDFKKSKELEELRKTGAAPPELDEDGKMINPHIPQYISQSPWYLQNNRPGLKHQYTKFFVEKKKYADITQFYSRGELHASGNKFRKGACENCGAVTHVRKECTERPRRKGARLTGQDIAPDEVIQQFDFDYEGKHDRWRGYDPAEYASIIQINHKAEEERKKKKMEEISAKHAEEATNSKKILKKKEKAERKKAKEAKKAAKAEKKAIAAAKAAQDKKSDASSDSDTDTEGEESDTDSDTDDVDDDEDLMDAGKVIHVRQDREKYTTNRTTARDLRIREDTAKYLRNLNVNSAHYDPKTRSMRENPYPDKDPNELMYAGDNYLRRSGDALVVAQVQNFVMAANDRGSDVNVLTNPSEAEHLFDQFKEKKEMLKKTRQADIIEKYGGKEHLDNLPEELRLAQSETYVEYNEVGEVVKGQEKAIPKTKYLEDVHEFGHSEIWGSIWKDGKWGYACCGNVLRSAFCTGESGRHAALLPGSSSSSSSTLSLMPPPAAVVHSHVPSSPAPTSLAKAIASIDSLTHQERMAQLLKKNPAADISMQEEPHGDEEEKVANDHGDGDGGDENGTKKKRKLNADKLKAREERRAERAARKEAKMKAKAEKSAKKRKRQDEELPDDDNMKQIREALAEEKKRLSHKTGDVEDRNVSKNKGGYNVVKTDLIPSEQELEAYHRLKGNTEDPMANYVDPGGD